MEFKIGTSLFIGGDSKYRLKAGIQGLDSPAIRVGSGVYAGRDGGFVSGHFYGHRTIVIPGFYIGEDCEDASQLREELMGYMRIRYQFPIRIKDFAGNYYFTSGFVTNVKSNITSPIAGDYQITLLCSDPILYIPTDPEDENSIWRSEVFTITNASTPTTISITNAGSAETYMKFTWNGDIPGFTATNNTTGKAFGMSGQPSGNTIIDFEKRLVTVDGIAKNGYRTTNSIWWALIPGINSITLTSTATGSKTGTYKYKFGEVGI